VGLRLTPRRGDSASPNPTTPTLKGSAYFLLHAVPADFLGHAHDLNHFSNRMNAHDVGASEDSGRYGRRRPPIASGRRPRSQRALHERLAGRPDQQRTQGSTHLADIILTRELDKSSTKVKEACANGTFFREVEIHLCATVGNKQEPYLMYKLKNAILTSYSFGGNASGSPLPTEQLSLGYTEAEWNYIVLNPETGKKEGNVPAKYHPAKGQA